MNKPVNCLMLKTSDDRCFFTHKNNYSQLVEFAKTCDAEISVVKANDVKVLELPELAKSICSHGKHPETPKYELMEIRLTKCVEVSAPRTRKKLLTQATIITEHVKNIFLAGEVVILSDLENKFSEFNLSKAAFCNHITRIRRDFKEKGYTIQKVKRGQYKILKEDQ